MINLIIRSEAPADAVAIGSVTERAFGSRPFSDNTEAGIIEALRARDALAVSLVAVEDETIIGHVAFSPAHSQDDAAGWYALGPIAVEPARQRQGIGSKLVIAGIAALRDRNAAGCIVLGDPAYYLRFGFCLAPENAPSGYPREYFMMMALAGSAPSCAIDFHDAFRPH